MAKKNNVVGIVEKLEGLVALAKEEAENFEVNEVNAAGLRVRKALAEIKAFAQEGRKLVTEVKNNRKKEKENSKKKKKK